MRRRKGWQLKQKHQQRKKEPKHLDRDEFDLEEIAYALTEAINESKYKAFSVYRKDELLLGIVTKMDANTRLIHIKDKYRIVHKVHFLDILSISDVD